MRKISRASASVCVCVCVCVCVFMIHKTHVNRNPPHAKHIP